MLPPGLPLDAFLDALATGRLRFSGPELRVLLRLAAAPGPLSAAALARDLRVSRRWAREVTAGLVACGCSAGSGGLMITAHPGRCGASPGRRRRWPPSGVRRTARLLSLPFRDLWRAVGLERRLPVPNRTRRDRRR
jgi:hypothetical protein